MSDVEGVRNLIGTGLVEFVGGMMTAVIALVYLIHTSVTMDRRRVCHPAGLRYGINKAFATDSPDFPGTAENQRGSHRAPHRIAQRRSGGEGLPRGRA